MWLFNLPLSCRNFGLKALNSTHIYCRCLLLHDVTPPVVTLGPNYGGVLPEPQLAEYRIPLLCGFNSGRDLRGNGKRRQCTGETGRG